jgi:hypothetical protein
VLRLGLPVLGQGLMMMTPLLRDPAAGLKYLMCLQMQDFAPEEVALMATAATGRTLLLYPACHQHTNGTSSVFQAGRREACPTPLVDLLLVVMPTSF